MLQATVKKEIRPIASEFKGVNEKNAPKLTVITSK
jgi:hypothetical protein